MVVTTLMVMTGAFDESLMDAEVVAICVEKKKQEKQRRNRLVDLENSR